MEEHPTIIQTIEVHQRLVQRNLVGLRAEVEFERTIAGKEQAETHPRATLVGRPEVLGTANPAEP